MATRTGKNYKGRKTQAQKAEQYLRIKNRLNAKNETGAWGSDGMPYGYNRYQNETMGRYTKLEGGARKTWNAREKQYQRASNYTNRRIARFNQIADRYARRNGINTSLRSVPVSNQPMEVETRLQYNGSPSGGRRDDSKMLLRFNDEFREFANSTNRGSSYDLAGRFSTKTALGRQIRLDSANGNATMDRGTRSKMKAFYYRKQRKAQGLTAG